MGLGTRAFREFKPLSNLLQSVKTVGGRSHNIDVGGSKD